MSRIVGKVYSLARILNDFSAILSGKPSRIARRGINKGIGRVAGPRIYLKGRKKR